MARSQDRRRRLERNDSPTLRSWEAPPGPAREQMATNVAQDMGWGRLLFGQTFEHNEALASALLQEEPGRRDIALYLRDPHVLVSLAPQELFLDPSHTYRLWSYNYRPRTEQLQGLVIRRLRTRNDAIEVNRIYETRRMVPSDPDFMLEMHATRRLTYFVALSEADGRILGTVTGVDHVEVFNDPEGGTSLWCLAVDPQAELPGVGEGLVRRLAEHYFARGRNYVDLSVMHDNTQAIRLYRKLGFARVPVFCLKRKNPINEELYTAPPPATELNPYAQIIVDEARRRGIKVEVLDAAGSWFVLSRGGRAITCRESLTEMTSAVALSRCDDKRLTRDCLERAGLPVPAQQAAGDPGEDARFLEEHGPLAVKPARGEQGAGITLGLASAGDLPAAIDAARQICPDVILEAMVEGEDLRVIVIDHQVVAAAVRRPPVITGTGQHTIRELIGKYNRRRAAATGGESQVPLDAETERVIRAEGYGMDDPLPPGATLTVRKTANLHTGGTIHDVTGDLHPEVAEACLGAARALAIPVVGLDLMVPDLKGPRHVFIEANERPGLANHEPQPTAERFIDFLFPQTAARRPAAR